jgi:hypothetical protein
MLLLSNYKRCSDYLAQQLSNFFVALDDAGKPVSALKSFDTDSGVAKTLTDTDFVPASWEFRARPLLRVPSAQRAENLRQRIVEAGHSFAHRVVAIDDSHRSFCSFCPPREVRHAFRDLWRGEHRYSLLRSAAEHEVMQQLYQAERALDRLDPPLIPYLDRLTAPHSVISTYMSCDGAKRGSHGGYIDFRTSLSPEEAARMIISLRFARTLPRVNDLGLRPLIYGPDLFYTCYNLGVKERGWERFEPVLAAFCQHLGL